jgi:hypothetical protein
MIFFQFLNFLSIIKTLIKMAFKKRKSVKKFLIDLRDLAEQGTVSDLKGSGALTEDEIRAISDAVAGLQNEMTNLEEIYKKLKLEPYNG